jgi:hypothetical protein
MRIGHHTPTLLAVALATALTACATSGPPEGTRVIDIDRMEEIADSRDEPFVVRIPEGTRLPVRVAVEAPFVRVEGGDPAFHAVFERTVYWFPRTPDRISFDGETWEAFGDNHSGRLSFGLGRSESKGSTANVYVGLVPDDAD